MQDWKSYGREAKRYVKDKPRRTIIALVLILGIFLIGFWHGQRKTTEAAPGGRKVLHYVDPMNPAHTSPEPGLAPCGMKMEPVYAEEDGQAIKGSMPPGTVKINPQKQQIIGVRVAPVERTPYIHSLRTLGKVAVDESRIYRLTAGVGGWIQQIYGNSIGSIVQKDEPLAAFYSPEFPAAQQAYIFALNSLDRTKGRGPEVPGTVEVPGQIENTNVQLYEDNLKKLGMSEMQIKEIQRTREIAKNIIIRSPATSFVIARNVSPGQQFERTAEFFRLADLSQIWILADLYENEAQFVKVGEKVRVSYPYQNKTFQATVSQVLPTFDPATRTLKVRLETDNPGYDLRPDMFVDVVFPVKLPPSMHVPVDAVLDSGLKQTVFVDRGNGFFEPRAVETGWRLGDRVEITRGLKPGEKIVISGNFLIDSESRMKLAAAGLFGEVAQDPVCGMSLEVAKAKAAGHELDLQGQPYYFCSDQCQEKFRHAPERYLVRASQEPAQESQDPGHGKVQSLNVPSKGSDPLPGQAPGSQGQKSLPNLPMAPVMPEVTRDPVCQMDVREPARASAPKTLYQGTTYYFCSDSCKQAFDKDPEGYLGKRPAPPTAAMPPMTPAAPPAAIPATPPVPTAPMPPATPPSMPPSGTQVAPPPAPPATPPGPTAPRPPAATPATPRGPASIVLPGPVPVLPQPQPPQTAPPTGLPGGGGHPHD